jgi:hypothetical protein
LALLRRRRYGAAMNAIPFSLAGVLAALAVLSPVPPAIAAEHHKPHKAAEAPAKPTPAGVQLLGTSGAWSAYTSNDSSGRVCYVAGEPKKSEPAKSTRKAPMAMVTHRPAENISNVVSFVEGYPLKPGSNVALDVGGRKFELFTKDDSAWASTSELDRTIVGALDKGKSATVRGEPAKGPATIDVYSLAGFPQALALIDKACGVKREEKAASSSAKPVHERERHRHHPVVHHDTVRP